MAFSLKTALVTVLAGFGCVAIIGCSGETIESGGTAPAPAAPAATVVSGTVMAPGRTIAFFKRPSLEDLFESEAYAALTGLANVPDGTIVQLARLNANTTNFNVITTTTTLGGQYSFNLTSLGLQPAHDLIVRVAGSSGKEMRAFVVGTVADLNPVSEAAYQLTLQSLGVGPLSNLTLREVSDISGAVGLIGSLQNLGAATSIDQAVDLVKTAVRTHVQLTEFLAAAAANGQTTQGTGDIGTFFPFEQNTFWRYQGISSAGTSYETNVLISGQGLAPNSRVNSTIFSETNDEGENRPEKSYHVKEVTGITSYGNDDPNDNVSRQLTPYQAVHFPLTAGTTTLLVERSDLEWSRDEDGDGRDETFSLKLSQTVFGIESITVPAGTFPNSLRMESKAVFLVSLTRGGSGTVTQTNTVWLVPGIGRVKEIVEGRVEDGPVIASLTEELLSYVVNGQGSGARIELGDGNLALGSPLNMRIENTRQLFGAVYDQANRLIPGVPLAFSSSNSQVASVDAQGLVTALSPGQTTLTARLGNITSNAVSITINDVRVLSLPTKDLIYDSISQRIYVSVPNRSSQFANTVTVINPVNGHIGPSIPVGNDPGKLAVSDNGQYLYVALNGDGRIQRVNLSTFTLGPSFALPSPECGLFSRVFDMEVLPSNPLRLAILRGHDCSPPGIAIEIYDNGIRRPSFVPTRSIVAIATSRQSNVLYGIEADTFSHIFEMAINSDGITISKQSASREDYFGSDLKYDSGRLFTSSMRIIDSATLSDVGLIQHPSIIHGGMIAPDLSRSRVFVIPESDRGTVYGFHASTLQPIGSIAIIHNRDGDSFGTSVNSLIRWGTDGLAYRTGYSPVYDHPNDRDLVVLIKTGAIE